MRGTVTSKEGPVAGVLVSDGYSIVGTDVQGFYSFAQNPQASFVFITVPAEYEIPARYGLPQHFQKLNDKSSSYDFTLRKLKGDPNEFVVCVTGDLHLSSKSQAVRWELDMVDDMMRMRKSYAKGTAFYMINLGDIVWREPTMFDEYNRIVATMSCPVFNVMGHADADHKASEPGPARKQFETRYGPRYYGFNRGHNYFIVLDDNIITGPATYKGGIEAEQMQWLARYLKFIPTGSRVIVCLHAPTMRRRSNPSNLPETGALHAMLKPYEAHFFSAHTHWLENYKPQGRFEHVHPSACGVYWDSHDYCKDGTPRGYGLYEFNADKMSCFYKSIGRDRDHQMNVYAPGVHPLYKDRIVANVWNWEDNWTVNWYQDGILMGPMERGYDYDYIYKWTLHQPSKNTFRDPAKVYHLFLATPEEGAKRIEIEVCDPYGRTYKQIVNLKNS